MFSFFKRERANTPIKGIWPRIRNVFLIHYRGLLGCLVPIIITPILLEKDVHWKTVLIMWITMIWFFLVQPVSVPVTALIPVFMLPMTGSMSTDKSCGCYMNEGIVMFIQSNMLLLLWNNSGLDRRLTLWFLCAGDTTQFSARRLVFKCCTGAFFLSMFCNRLIVCSIMTQYVTKTLMAMEASSKKSGILYDEMRYILNSAIQTSCSIGSIAIVHSSFATLAFRAIFYENTLSDLVAWQDIFNYLDYSSFAFPVTLVMLVCNINIHMLLVHTRTGNPLTNDNMNTMRNKFWEFKNNEIPRKVTIHEKLTLFFSILCLLMFFLRWNKFFSWSDFRTHNSLPLIRDSTGASMFIILLHSLPSGFGFLKFLTAKKKSQLGKLKPESGILWWRFVDKNINYGYFYLIGSGVAICTAVRYTNMDVEITNSAIGKLFSEQPLLIYLLLVCFITVLFTNMMTGVAACVSLMPFVMNMHKLPPAPPTTPAPVEEAGLLLRSHDKINFEKEYLGALAVGIGSSLGFMCPFLYTPAYFCHYTGKVPLKKMAIYALGPAIICFLILWASMSFYAPVIWDSSVIKQDVLPTASTKLVITTTEAIAGEGE